MVGCVEGVKSILEVQGCLLEVAKLLCLLKIHILFLTAFALAQTMTDFVINSNNSFKS